MKKHLKKYDSFVEVLLYLVVFIVFDAFLMIRDIVMGILFLCILLTVSLLSLRIIKSKKKNIDKYIKNLSENIDWTSKNAFVHVPLPLVMLEPDGTINWYNTKFKDIFNESKLYNCNIKNVVTELDYEKLLNEKGESSQIISIGDKKYSVVAYKAEIESGGGILREAFLLYWLDITDSSLYKEKYEKAELVACLVQIDSYDEVMSNTDEEDRPAVIAEIDKRIRQWILQNNGILRKYERDKFTSVFEKQHLTEMQSKKFDILDSVREIKSGNRIPVTLSIGIGTGGENPAENNDYANDAIQLALGRGGDQAVVKINDKLSFYGGKTQAVEKRTKVKSRVIAYALRQLIEQSDDVFIMGHDTPDLDSIGSAIGLYRCAAVSGKKAYIVICGSNAGIDQLLTQIEKNDEYNNVIISGDEASKKIGPKSLLIIVDTQRPSFTDCPELLELTDRIIVIDHHRRGTESFDNTLLSYLEPYASSTAELVTEIIQYYNDKIRLKPIEADSLLSGLTVDTKSFSFKTGVRTFEAAAYLRRSGADTTAVRQLFQDDFDTFSARSEIVRNAKYVSEGIVISVCPEGTKNVALIAAQSADALITIRGISASFVLCRNGSEIMISGRSLGNINVQLILEKLGGGGHLSVAGAQISGITMDQAVEMVKNAINEYLKEAKEK